MVEDEVAERRKAKRMRGTTEDETCGEIAEGTSLGQYEVLLVFRPRKGWHRGVNLCLHMTQPSLKLFHSIPQLVEARRRLVNVETVSE